ncbi:MAG: hypothetical protein KAJ63_11025 [Methyloprofundus sp.]|nr:hypothetical protein [Methyloprofundus sp.]
MKIVNYLSVKSLMAALVLGLTCVSVYALESSVQTTIATVSVISGGVTYNQENIDFSDLEGVKEAIDTMVSAGAGTQESVTELFIQHAMALTVGTALVYVPVKVSGGQVIPTVIDPGNSAPVAQVSEAVFNMGGSSSGFQTQLASAPGTLSTLSTLGIQDAGSLGESVSGSDSSEQQVQGGGVDVSPQ